MKSPQQILNFVRSSLSSRKPRRKDRISEARAIQASEAMEPRLLLTADLNDVLFDALVIDEIGLNSPVESYFVRFEAPQDEAALIRDSGAQSVSASQFVENGYTLEFQSGMDLQEAADLLSVLPDFDYLHPNTLVTPVVAAVPNDPLYPDQWHFNNTGQSGGLAGADSNIESVWDNYTGRGVVLGIIDDSFETGHEDFAGKVNTVIDFDYEDGDNDPNPDAANDNHGTAVAGIAGAAGDNGIGGVGAAWDAELVGLKLIGGPLTDNQIASALSHESQVIDIYNNSWGPASNGRTFSTAPESLAALETAAQDGRGGLGNIHVFAAGNSNQFNDNVNYAGYAKSRHTIAVAALLDTGVQASYSNPGAPLIVSGWADPVTTTDRTGAAGYDDTNYTSTFNGTSSAAPHVSGVIALMLEANPNLTYRDVVDILVHSSERVDPTHPDWVQNGAGLWVNHEYGHGGIDAAAAVDLALTHETLPDEEIYQTGVQTVSQAIPDQGVVSSTVTIPAGENLQIEHVELVLNASHSYIGDLEIVLTSPSGTQSVLADTRVQDAGNSYSNFTFMSARHWDELSAGEWTVTIRDGAAGDSGTFNSFELIVYGTPPEGLKITETGTGTLVSDYILTDLFSVSLPMQPTSDVVLTVTSQNVNEVTVDPVTLTFTPQNYAIPQDVQVSGVLDLVTDGNQVTNVVISVNDALSDDMYDATEDAFVSVTSRDDDGSVPGKPTFVSPDPFDGGNRPIFAWQGGIRSETFTLEVRNVLTGLVVNQVSGLRGTSFSFAAGFPDGLYEATVQAFNSMQQGSEIDTLTFNVGDPIVPGQPTITSPVVGSLLSINQPTIEWTALPAALEYELYFRTGRTVTRVTTPGIDLGNGSRGYVVPSALAEGLTSVWVRGFNFFGTAGPWSPAVNFTVDAFLTPDIPRITAPLLDVTSDAFPIFEWTPVANATNYELWVSELRAGTGTPQVPAIYDRVIHLVNEPLTFYRHFRALNEGTHLAWVRAFNAAGEASRWSPAERFAISVPDPGVPTLVDNQNTQDTTPTFEWSTASATAGTTYRLWVNNLSTGQTRVIDESEIVGNSYTPKEPLEQGRHAYWVRATNSVGELGVWSDRAIINIDVLPPARSTVTGPVPDVASGDTVVKTEFPTFTWDPVFNGVSYQLWVNHDDSNTSQVINLSGIEGTSYTAEIALPQGNFRAWVRARNSAGEVGPWSTAFSLFLDVPTPSKPVVVAPVPNPVGAVIDPTPTIQWQTDVPGNTYDLQLVDVITNEFVINTTGLTGLTYTVPFELQERQFQVRVRGVNTIGEPSEWSDFYQFRIDEPNATTPVALGPTGTVRQNDIVFSWQHSPDSIRYDILVRDLVRGEDIVIRADTFDVDNGLNIASFAHNLNNGTYRFWVRAFNTQGTASGWSNSVSFIVDRPLAGLEDSPGDDDGLLTSLRTLSDEASPPEVTRVSPVEYQTPVRQVEESASAEDVVAIEMVMAEIADPQSMSPIGPVTLNDSGRKVLQ